MEKQFWKRAVWLYLAVYLAASLLLLTRFPMMHSDESWLSGLSRAMLQGGLGQTEPFFDMVPTYPNAVSILFNFIQMAFITVFGYGLFTVRLISLVFGAATLILFYRLILFLSASEKKALAAAVILSLDAQFIAASHLARQDIIITFGVVAVVYHIIRYAGDWRVRRDILTGVLVGMMAGVHPNGLLVAFAAGALYLYYIGVKRMRVRNLLLLILITAGFAGVYVGASFLMDADFPRHYFAYGSTLGVGMSLADKLRALPNYSVKLYYGISGTYMIPPVRLQLIVFAAGILGSAVYSVFKRDMLRFLLPLVAALAAVVLIGRYSQPAIIIIFPLCWLLVFMLLDKLPAPAGAAAALILGAALLVQAVITVRPYMNKDYEHYLARIEAAVPADAMVLANLNSEYAFKSGRLLDYRNLQYLDGMTFEEYIRSRDIEYIIYPEEMDYIYKNRPVWNILYGNLYPYYEDMKAFCDTSCTLTDEFQSPYAMRITGLPYAQDWDVRIYRVKGEM